MFPTLRETRGKLGQAKISALASDEQLAAKLWEVSEEATVVRYGW
ncbi:hypothetical protein [Curtobacterium sp. S6]|nr:hypothetical protein [Curtobacterium sp. S6]